MAESSCTVTIALDAVDEALLGALAAANDLEPEVLAQALLSGVLQRINDAAWEVDCEQSH